MNTRKIEIKEIIIPGLEKIENIIHTADVHIRTLKRHDEYREVFLRTYAKMQEIIKPGDVIFLLGDIVHAKTDVTPELFIELTYFFKLFCSLAPVILIAGNHDCNLNNSARVDALTPVVDALGLPNLVYLKDSGVYKIADKHITVMSVFDTPDTYIQAHEFEGEYKIACFHGAVHGTKTDFGFMLENESMKTEIFTGYDLVLLGDIHTPNQHLQYYSNI